MFNNKDYSTKLLGLQGVIIENIEEKMELLRWQFHQKGKCIVAQNVEQKQTGYTITENRISHLD